MKIAFRGEALSELATDFIGFVMSYDGQAIVAEDYVAALGDAPPFAGGLPGGRLVIAGSSAVAPVMERLIEAYSVINENADVQMQFSDSTSGLNGVVDGIFHIGMSSRPLRDSEKLLLDYLTIAMDGIVIIVNNENILQGLTKEVVGKIFKGRLTVWNEVL